MSLTSNLRSNLKKYNLNELVNKLSFPIRYALLNEFSIVPYNSFLHNKILLINNCYIENDTLFGCNSLFLSNYKKNYTINSANFPFVKKIYFLTDNIDIDVLHGFNNININIYTTSRIDSINKKLLFFGSRYNIIYSDKITEILKYFQLEDLCFVPRIKLS